MTREEQIEAAARQHWLNTKGDQAELDFIEGTKWADENPINKQNILHITGENAVSYINELKGTDAKLAIALDALKGAYQTEHVKKAIKKIEELDKT